MAAQLSHNTAYQSIPLAKVKHLPTVGPALGSNIPPGRETQSLAAAAASPKESYRVPTCSYLMPLYKRSSKKEHVTMVVSQSSASTATAPTITNHNSFSQSPAAIPPRTSSTFSTTGFGTSPPIPTKAPLRSVPEGDWLAGSSSSNPHTTAPGGHARHRSRKASVTSVGGQTITSSSFPTAAMASPPPPPDPNRFATEDFFTSRSRLWSAEKEKVLTGPFDYLNEHPGKDFRSQLVKAFDAWLQVPPESLEVITKVIGMLHTASLLVDDVEDSSVLRRGFPVAHSIFGVPQTINSSNYIYFCALQELQKLKNPKAVAVFTEELLNLHRGQGMDLFWRDTLTCPTEDDYLEMVSNKTGGLFRLGIKLMQAESRSLIDCVPLVNLVGLIFQIADDHQNLWSRQYTANKGMCEDLTEGKFSFPVIHSIRSNPNNLQLLNILKQKTADEEVKRYAVAYMESTGSFAYTVKVLEVLIERARKMTDEIDEGRGVGRGIHAILDRMVIKHEL
ncbi:putative farnesyltranstransferase [Apodospora peruviana]|uniref:Farnesyltranstransferase n=1 Tax=Apodospora peruviana TaxID=516989 RepID=A0AAE0IHV9_9PEZI|nr:putative farnesyltranstransferase [Apodospora peruviana]